jgi:hypothetical protein
MANHPRRSRLINLVQSSEDFFNQNEPPLSIGAVVRLNSGSPAMVVVDFDNQLSMVVAWRSDDGGYFELTLPRKCIHRVRHGEA